MLPDPFNPFSILAAAPLIMWVSDAWTRMMLSLWNSGVWLLKVVPQLESFLLTPDLSTDGALRRFTR